MGFGLRVTGYELWVMSYGFWVLGYGFWVLGYGFWTEQSFKYNILCDLKKLLNPQPSTLNP
jgi:hypothetical protein